MALPFPQIKKIFITLLFALSFMTPALAVISTASAADAFGGAKNEACKGVELGGNDTNQCSEANSGGVVSKIVKDLIDLLSVVVGILCVIVIIISGFRYITAGGDSNNIASARNTFIYALVGLIIVAFAQLIVKLVLGKISG